jgi:hypothetical protein
LHIIILVDVLAFAALIAAPGFSASMAAAQFF